MLNDQKGYRMSCQADVDMRQYRFERRSGLPAGYFDTPRWYRNQDTLVFLAVIIVGVLALAWSH